MEKFITFKAQNPPSPKYLERTFPQHIKKLCKGGRNKEKAPKLLCAAFRSNVHKSTAVDTNWPLALKNKDSSAVHANLKRMYEAEDSSYNVLMWSLCPYATFERWNVNYIDQLVTAVRERIPPFYQYMDENNKPMIDFNLPSIKEIGNGMYARYPKDQEGETKVAARRPVTFLNFPKTVTWDSIKTFHISYRGPVVYDI